MILVLSILCKPMKLKTLVTSLALQQIKVGMEATQKTLHYHECTCKIQWYKIFMLSLSILGLILYAIIKSRKLKLFRGHLFLNTVKLCYSYVIQNIMYP